jgi:hypothetical protein
MTTHEALSHPFVAEESPENTSENDLLPNVKKNFSARRTLHVAIDTIRAIHKLREGGAMSDIPVTAAKGDKGDMDKTMTDAPPMPVEERPQDTGSTGGLWQPGH